MVAKILKESKSNGDEFFNEVASISTTSHINNVTVMGCCFEESNSFMSLCKMDLLKSSYKTKITQMLTFNWDGKHCTRLQLAWSKIRVLA